MRITKSGTIVRFDCQACGSRFVIGIHSAETPDKGENYYCHCPVCGSECHATVNDRKEIGGNKKDGTGQEQKTRT